MDIQVNDIIPTEMLAERLKRNEENIMNTALFNSVSINVKEWNDAQENITLSLDVQESWYIYPIPVVELADRDFNVWWTEHNRDLDRINLGFKLYHFNLSGNRDRAKVNLQTGYTRKYELEYQFPYLNKGQTLGLNFITSYLSNREIGYNTENNKLLFYRDDHSAQLQRFRMDAGLSYRKKIYTTHTLMFQWHWNKISDLVADSLNSAFLIHSVDATRTGQRYLGFTYIFDHDRRNVKPYPTAGYLLSFQFEKHGLGIWGEKNTWFLTPRLAGYRTLGARWSIGASTQARIDLNQHRRAYTDYTALGYQGTALRGYALYIIDGSHYAIAKGGIKFLLIDRNWNWGKPCP